MAQRSAQRGFTLVELMVTVADPEQCPETAALREALGREFAELTR